MANQQLPEFVWGPAGSSYDFLWVIRADMVASDAAVLPLEFMEATRGKGPLESWCPQEAVLHHEAMGVFLTHSGWNCTLESLFVGEGLEWGVAIEVGSDTRRDVVQERIREVVAREKGKEMRKRAAEWKEAVARATWPGGSSFDNLDRLIKDVLLKRS
ncbi:hypothetical protein SETIT_1G149600v2 [Setaria italica]|uniref:Uncharacterized protein n=1 Tax=Setaria italica TaxID=4555 RepID=A0A368PKT9_SETIT|nr:hypothetical protein SETIT_1G149600v2 [Setaria italica]